MYCQIETAKPDPGDGLANAAKARKTVAFIVVGRAQLTKTTSSCNG